jgi:hypothetical protein
MQLKKLLKTIPSGQPFHAAIASIDTVGSSRLAGTIEERTKTKAELHKLVRSVFGNLRVGEHDWKGDGGVFIADCTNGIDSLIQACDALLSMLAYFNRSKRTLNHLPHDFIHLRIVIHAGIVENSGDPGEWGFDELEALVKSEKLVGLPDRIVVTSAVYSNIFKDALRERFTLLSPEPHRSLGACYVLDRANSVGTIRLNDPATREFNHHEADRVRNWIRAVLTTDPPQFDEVNVFSHSFDSLSELVGFPIGEDVRVRVLARNWVEESHDEALFADRAERSAAVRRQSAQVIERNARVLEDNGWRDPHGNSLDVRFHAERPTFRGVLLRNSADGRRAGHLGVYAPAASTSDVPFERSWAGLWVSDDGGPNKHFLDSAQRMFELQWARGLSSSEMNVASERHEATHGPEAREVWALDDDLPYLIVSAGHVDRHIAYDDMDTIMNVARFLGGFGIEPKTTTLTGTDSDLRELEGSQGHIVFVCYRSLTDQIRSLLTASGFPIDVVTDGAPHFVGAGDGIVMRSPRDEANASADAADLALVAKWPSPWPGRWWFVIAGLHGPGTRGGGAFNVDHSELRKVFAENGAGPFVRVVAAHPDGRHSVRLML